MVPPGAQIHRERRADGRQHTQEFSNEFKRLVYDQLGRVTADPRIVREFEAEGVIDGHAAGNAAARDVHSKAGFVLALCDAFRRVDESRE